MQNNSGNSLKPIIRFLFKILFLLLIPTLYFNDYSLLLAREFNFEKLNIRQGLSQNSVYCILQDEQGFLWFGTQDGLNRFDGYKFKIFRNDPEDSTSLAGNWIFTLMQDQSGAIWVGTFHHGLSCFDLKTETFTTYRHAPDDSLSLPNDIVTTLAEAENGDLWIATAGGLSLRQPDENRFQNFPVQPPEIANCSSVIYSMALDSAGVLWLGTRSGLWLFDTGQRRFLPGALWSAFGAILSEAKVYKVYLDKRGIVWVGTEKNGLFRIEPDSKKVTQFKQEPENPASLSSNFIADIYEDSFGQLWIGTFEGLDLFDRQTETFRQIKNDPKNSASLSDDHIRCIFEDKSQILWIGTEVGGANKLLLRDDQFHHLSNNPEDSNSLSYNIITSIFEDRQGFLWCGTFRGLNRIDRMKNEVKRFFPESGNPESVSDVMIGPICQDSRGNVWIGTIYRGLNKYNPETGKFTRFLHDPDNPAGLSNNTIISLLPDGDWLWIGTEGGGLDKLNLETGGFINFPYDPENPNGIAHSDICALFRDSKGRFWIGTRNGLNLFDETQQKFKVFQFNPKDSTTISHNIIYVIHEAKNGILWLGTYGGGLNRFDPETGIFTRFMHKDGLANNLVNGILEDKRGCLWISTTGGISKFDPVSKRFKNYTVNDGLQSNEFNSWAYFQNHRGEMFFGGINGINYFHPDSIRDNPHVPPVALTDFQLLNHSIEINQTEKGRILLSSALNFTESINLNYKDDVISFEFTALDYTHPEKNQYAYFLEGFDNQWNYIGTRRFVTYTNLPHGTYTFHVKGSNNDGIWNETGNSIQLRIKPPYWNTRWFQLLMVLVAILIIITLHWVRIYTFRKKNRQLQEINEKLNEQIIQREKAEQDLLAEKEQLAVTLFSIGDGVITTDTFGNIMLINKAASHLTGWPESEAIGVPLENVFHIIDETTHHRCGSPVDRVIVTHRPLTVDLSYLLVSREGKERIIASNAAPIHDKDQNVIGVVLVFRDVTEKKKYEADILKTSKLESVGILAGGLAHDFNNILTAILGNISLAKIQIDQEDDVYPFLEQAEEASVRAKNLTQRLLTFARGGSPVRKILPIGELIREAVGFALTGTNIHARFEIDADLWPVNCDRNQILQVIDNLIINSIQAMPEGGQVLVKAENLDLQETLMLPISEGPYVNIEIHDQGVGIPEKYLTKIFDPYFTTKHKGSGLGLATVYSIIKNHEGHIMVDSEVAVGTTLNVYLPAVPEESSNKKPEASVKFISGTGRILVMDDEKIVRQIARQLLERCGYEVSVAGDGSEALEMYKQALEENNRFDLVLMDLTIPVGMGGKEAIKFLMEMDSDVKAVVSSGYSNDPIMAHYEDYGFSGVISKPYKIYDLSEVVAEVLNV